MLLFVKKKLRSVLHNTSFLSWFLCKLQALFITSLKASQSEGGFRMADLWVITFGIVGILGLFGGILMYFLSKTLDSRDASKVDALPPNKDN